MMLLQFWESSLQRIWQMACLIIYIQYIYWRKQKQRENAARNNLAIYFVDVKHIFLFVGNNHVHNCGLGPDHKHDRIQIIMVRHGEAEGHWGRQPNEASCLDALALLPSTLRPPQSPCYLLFPPWVSVPMATNGSQGRVYHGHAFLFSFFCLIKVAKLKPNMKQKLSKANLRRFRPINGRHIFV